ncbi:MAG: hypothetical protein Q9167_004529 [Letrouitia subvulpina]
MERDDTKSEGNAGNEDSRPDLEAKLEDLEHLQLESQEDIAAVRARLDWVYKEIMKQPLTSSHISYLWERIQVLEAQEEQKVKYLEVLDSQVQEISKELTRLFQETIQKQDKDAEGDFELQLDWDGPDDADE